MNQYPFVKERFGKLIYKESSERVHAAATEQKLMKWRKKSLPKMQEHVKKPNCDDYEQEYMDNNYT